MTTTKQQRALLDHLAGHSLVKAALIIDDRGYIKERTGSARSVRTTDRYTPVDRNSAAPKESIYVAGAGEDFVVVVFDEGIQFEKLKADVDDAISNRIG